MPGIPEGNAIWLTEDREDWTTTISDEMLAEATDSIALTDDSIMLSASAKAEPDKDPLRADSTAEADMVTMLKLALTTETSLEMEAEAAE